MRRAALLLAAAGVLAGGDFKLRLAQPAEVVAVIEPRAGADTVPLTITVDGRNAQRAWAFAGMQPEVFLGELAEGEHSVSVDAANVRFRELRPGAPEYEAIANAPVLYARPDTADRPTDMPLLAYCERIEGGLQYTVVFSNEDGGTSTRALMARWGRTADIEYTFRLGAGGRGTFQGKDHEELEFAGRREGAHPVLYVSTDNNMVADHGEETVRYQLAPALVDLGENSRERVMDEHPWIYRVCAGELRREEKLRAPGRVEGEKISDPRNYLSVEMKLANEGTAVAALVRLKGEPFFRSSSLGRLDYAVNRSGWVRTTIGLPPGTPAADAAEIAFECSMVPNERGKWPQLRPCTLEAVSKVFLLGRDYVPQESVWSLRGGVEIEPGQVRVFPLKPEQPQMDTDAHR